MTCSKSPHDPDTFAIHGERRQGRVWISRACSRTTSLDYCTNSSAKSSSRASSATRPASPPWPLLRMHCMGVPDTVGLAYREEFAAHDVAAPQVIQTDLLGEHLDHEVAIGDKDDGHGHARAHRAHDERAPRDVRACAAPLRKMLSSLPMTMTSRLQSSPTDMDDLLFRMHYLREVSIAQHTVLGLAARSSLMTRPRQCERGHQGTYASNPALPHLAAPVVAAGRRVRVLLQHTWSAAVRPRRGRLQ